jgi:Leucine-rich repeat (LRR) protein
MQMVDYYDPKYIKLNIIRSQELQGMKLTKLKALTVYYAQPLPPNHASQTCVAQMVALRNFMLNTSDDSDDSFDPIDTSDDNTEDTNSMPDNDAYGTIPHEFLASLPDSLEFLKLASHPVMNLDFLAIVNVRKLELRAESFMKIDMDLLYRMNRLEEVSLSYFHISYSQKNILDWKTFTLQNCHLRLLETIRSNSLRMITLLDVHGQDGQLDFSLIPNIEMIKIQGDRLSIVWPGQSLWRLVQFRISNMFTDGALFRIMPNLEELELYSVSISNWNWIHGLQKLNELKWNDSDVPSDFRLQNLPNLVIAHFNLDRLENLNFLEGLEKLHTLHLSFSNIGEYELKGMKNLKHLIAEHNEVQDLHFLQGLELETLKLSFNNITDIAALQEMKSLKVLDLSHNRITSIEPLRNLENLEFLLLYMNEIDDIEPLQGLPKLKELDISDNKISVNAHMDSFRSYQKLRKLPTLPVPRSFGSLGL